MENLIAQLSQGQFNSSQSLWLFFAVFLGGALTSLSPCSFGLLPIIVGYVGGYSEKESKKTVIQILFFVAGLSLVLTVLGVSCALAGITFGAHSSPVWALIMASLILIMGLNLLEIIEIPMPAIVKEFPKNRNNSLIFFPLLLGGLFAFASTPCSTPLLVGIMAYASLKANLLTGASLLFAFSMGQGLILVIAALFTSLFKKMTGVRKISGYFMKFSGIVLILSAFFIYFKVFGIL